MTFRRRHLALLAGGAAALLVGWLVMAALRPVRVAAPPPQAPPNLTAEQVIREAHPVNLPQRPGAPGSVPMALRRATSDTCEGYNLELVEAAAIETRQGRHESAARLLALRQDCAAGASPHHRSSLR